MTTNPWEAKARQTKATALAEHIWDRMTPEERCSIRLADAVAGFTQDERDTLATDAGQHSPSAQTWTVVVARIAKLVEWAREAVA